MKNYDSAVIREYASKLYARAAWNLFLFPVFVAGLGGIAGGVWRGQDWGLGGLIAGVLVGYYIASQRAFQLRLLAQNALCQVQIEENTRPTRAEPIFNFEEGESQRSSANEAPDNELVKNCVARLSSAGCRVNHAVNGGWEVTEPSGASSVARSLNELRSITAQHAP